MKNDNSGLIINMFVTCFHEFRNYEFLKFFSFLLKQQGRIFILTSKIFAKAVCFLKEIHSVAPLKENKTFFVKKIRGFEIRENLS